MTQNAKSTARDDSLDAEQVGYKQTLGRRHVQMIAIGGAIGTGLFLGSASRLHSTGPALLFSYAFVGVIAYFLMRALGELVLHRATSGAFVSYMREFFGERAAFVTGWLYWLNWALTGIAELSAVGLYVQYWFPTMPTWAHGADRAGRGAGDQPAVGPGLRRVRVLGVHPQGRRDRRLPGRGPRRGGRRLQHRRSHRPASPTCGATRAASGRPEATSTGTARSW